MTYDWDIAEYSAFATGSLQTSVSYNNQQDNIVVDVPSPPTGQPDTTTGIGPFILFGSAPSLSDAGTFIISCEVTDNNGTVKSNELDVVMTFG